MLIYVWYPQKNLLPYVVNLFVKFQLQEIVANFIRTRKIYKFLCGYQDIFLHQPYLSQKKTSNNKNFWFCSLALMTLPHQWQLRCEFGKTWFQGGTTSLPCISWTATWMLASTAFPALQKDTSRLEKFSPDGWTLLVCQRKQEYHVHTK